jgi:hypothetical protein
VLPTGTADRYQYTGTYHGIVHSHLDSLDCHMMVDGKGYNGVAMEDITAAGGCPKGSINALKDGLLDGPVRRTSRRRLPAAPFPRGIPCDRLPVGVSHDVAARDLVGAPGRREATGWLGHGGSLLFTR